MSSIQRVTPIECEEGGDRGPARVLVVEHGPDHDLVSEALALAIDAQDDLECAAVASSLEDTLRFVAEHAPDVVLLTNADPSRLDVVEGVEKVKALRPRTRVLVFAAGVDLDDLARAAAAGTSAFLPPDAPVSQILAAIRAAVRGRTMFECACLPVLLRAAPPPRRRPLPLPRLTNREHEVLALLGEGLHPQEAARRLGISVHTCRDYVKSILHKLGVHSQLEAVAVAHRQGLLRA